jgi:hypothetical protein
VAEFFGETFDAPERFNVRLLTRLGTLAQRGVDTDDMEGMAHIDRMVDQCVRAEDAQRFDDLCDREMPTFEELMGFCMEVIAEITERPTERPSDSSDGPATMSDTSAGDSSLRVIEREVEAGRPSRALMVMQASEARGSRASA